MLVRGWAMCSITRIGIRSAVPNIGLLAVFCLPVPGAQLPAQEHDKPEQERCRHDQRRGQRLQTSDHAGASSFAVPIPLPALSPMTGRGALQAPGRDRPARCWQARGRPEEASAPEYVTRPCRTPAPDRRHVAGSGGVFHADLHIHSRFSRACSKDSEIPHLAWWAARKGVTVVGTGDFTHPAWAVQLAESLVPAEPGLFRLRPELASRLSRTLPPSCTAEIRFLLSTEISTIYRRDGATRKVHHLLYAPTFEAADTITAALAKVGNLASDGRPILGLDSRHLLEITLNAGPGCFLIPAHIWTPWFAVLGSKSGFDTVPECSPNLADHVFAVDACLSSDPPMNWNCSSLERYQLVSNSDAHSPPMLGREATTFRTAVDYFAMLRALRTGQGLAGTLNFFPEGGRYHADGHRKCGVRLFPAESVRHAGICPKCGKPLTIGVMNRVAELADRPEGFRPPGAATSANMVSLPEIIGEVLGSGRQSKRVTMEVDRLIAALGPELHILCDADTADIGRIAGSLVAEAITRLRNGEVIKEAGYDGEYGVIRLFRPEELAQTGALFDVPAPAAGREESFEIPAPAVSGEELFDGPARAVGGKELPGVPAVSE